MADITVEKIDEKLKKGEVLTKEETEFVMSLPPEEAGQGNKAEITEEEIEWEKAEEIKEEETPEAKKEKEEAEKKKKEEEAKKVEEEKKKKEEEEAKDPFLRIERELAKPEGQESLEGFTDREKAYFHQMRRDRKSRQKAEEERDAARFREVQRKNEEEAKAKEKEVEDPLAELKKKDQDDFMTVGEVVGILEKAIKKPATKEEPKREGIDPVRVRYLKMCDEEARKAHAEDYDATMELTEEIVNKNETYLIQIAQAIANGENPAEKTYQLIKSDPEFSKLYPAAETKVKARKLAEKKPESKTPEELEKEKKAKEAEEALEKNKEKIKTTGHATGETGAEEESGKIDGYSITDIVKMSDLQFAKLPKKTREKFLQMYG